MKVHELMTNDPRACGPNDPVSRAAQIMWEADCGFVPVVNEEGRVVSIITDRDICMAAYTRGLALSDIRVGTAASRRLLTVSPDEEIATAEQLMREFKIRRLPVVDGAGKLVGVLSMNDLVRRTHNNTHRWSDPSAEGVVKTLAAICSPPNIAAASR
jgi:CBS domain-containing protein